jgi:hypothetical protein
MPGAFLVARSAPERRNTGMYFDKAGIFIKASAASGLNLGFHIWNATRRGHIVAFRYDIFIAQSA